MNIMSYETGSSKINYLPVPIEGISPIVDHKERTLIALVGKAGTGKHTYLDRYYKSSSDMSMNRQGVVGRSNTSTPLSYSRSIEQGGVHPHEQQVFLDKLRSTQVSLLPDPFMFVTYSPYILDAMGWAYAHNVIFFHMEEVTRRFYRGSLLCNPRFSSAIHWASENITLGQFWYKEGEQWLKEYGEDVTDPPWWDVKDRTFLD